MNEFDKDNLNVPNLSILGTDNSNLFAESDKDHNDANLPDYLANHRGFNTVFQKGKLTFGLIAPFKGYPHSPVPDIEDIGEVAQLADKLGFSALWLRDVPFYDPNFGDVGQGFDPLVMMGYLAAKTENIAIGTAGLVSPLREPIHIAKAAASADRLTNGRFILGLSSGDRPVEYPAFKAEFNNRAERFREAWDMIRLLTDAKVEFPKFSGHHYGSLDGSIDMTPKLANRLPMVSIGRSRQDLEWLSNEADAWIWHGVDPKDTGNIIRTIADKNEDNTWHPFAYSNFVELLEDPDAPVRLYNNIYLRGGSKGMAEYWAEQKEKGLSHVTINLKPTSRPYEEVLQDLKENVLEKMND